MKSLYLPVLLSLALAGQVFAAKVIPNHAIADLVLGQEDFVTGSPPVVRDPTTLSGPAAVVVDPMSGKLFVLEYSSYRILRFASANSLTNGAPAEAVFGQSRFSDSSSGNADQKWGLAYTLFFDRKGRLWLSDYSNNRVLMFEVAAYRSSTPYADRVFGQPDFTTYSSGTTASKMDSPIGVCVDTNDRLWVTEYGNNRVLRFDNITDKPSGSAADGVLGQATFLSNGSGLSASNMNGPAQLAVSNTGALFVAEYINKRILRFNNAAQLGNGAGASGVLGQVDFVTATAGLSASALSGAWGVHVTPDDTLWVTELGRARVLRFSTATTLANGASADGVIGQADFTTNTASITNRGLGLNFYSQPFVDAASNLWVPDFANNRVLRFQPDVTKPLLTLTGTVPKTIKKKTVVIKGTASDAYGISKIQYRIGTGALKTASGTTSWQFTASLKKGKNTITIIATDSVGNVSLSKVVRVKRK